MNITVTYVAKWQLKNKPYYKWTECKKLINCQTNREVKKTMKGSQAGYYIDRKFIKITELKFFIELIKKDSTLPF